MLPSTWNPRPSTLDKKIDSIQVVVAFTEPGNAHLGCAIMVKMKESSTHHAAEQTLQGKFPIHWLKFFISL